MSAEVHAHLTSAVKQTLQGMAEEIEPLEVPRSAAVEPPFSPGSHPVAAQPAVQTIGLTAFLPILLQYAPYITDALIAALNARYGASVRTFLQTHADQLRALANDRDWQLISELLNIVMQPQQVDPRVK